MQNSVGNGNVWASRKSKAEYIKELTGNYRLELEQLTWRELVNNQITLKTGAIEKVYRIIKNRTK